MIPNQDKCPVNSIRRHGDRAVITYKCAGGGHASLIIDKIVEVPGGRLQGIVIQGRGSGTKQIIEVTNVNTGQPSELDFSPALQPHLQSVR